MHHPRKRPREGLEDGADRLVLRDADHGPEVAEQDDVAVTEPVRVVPVDLSWGVGTRHYGPI